jgi:hypothetical protein
MPRSGCADRRYTLEILDVKTLVNLFRSDILCSMSANKRDS